MNKKPILITSIIAFITFCSFYKNNDDLIIQKKNKFNLNDLQNIDYSYNQFFPDNNFSQFPIMINNLVLSEVELLLKKKGFLQRVFRNSKYYLPTIELKLKEGGFPQELQFLPVIESGLNNFAVSPAGAVGMWQFTDITASQYGLTNKYSIDERKDFVKATVSACKFLKYLYRTTNDWYLTLAAYNAGPTFLKNILDKSQEKQFFLLAESGYFKNETVRFIPRFIAMYFIFKYANQLCPELYRDRKNIIIDSIEIAGYESIAEIIRFSEMSMFEFKMYNAHLTKLLSLKKSIPGSFNLPQDKKHLINENFLRK